MAKALIPFYVLFIGDGSATVFTLDLHTDPFFYAQDGRLAFDASDTFPGVGTLSSDFDRKMIPSAVANVAAKNVLNGNDMSYSSSSITQEQIAFTLGSAPSNGTVFVVYGYLQY